MMSRSRWQRFGVRLKSDPTVALKQNLKDIFGVDMCVCTVNSEVLPTVKTTRSYDFAATTVWLELFTGGQILTGVKRRRPHSHYYER